ncbi:MAG: FecR domain-containing protein [Kaiparowitsia implicata GSE-PSE-MK54-09C]|jgi:hypothetical protein|nr:FecR domain-containing protein [Kaiparowitsia implicata GSE-PSE-MK54-09C]
MTIFNRLSVLTLTGLALAAAQPALADDWIAERLRGSVLTLQDGQWVPLQRGDVIPDDRYIKTLGNGRVQFTRGAETIDLAGHTMVQILDRDGEQFTNVHQHYGQVAVEAEKRDVNHFAVVTPHMASIVKGTQFLVRSGSTGASVSVNRGQVNVADPKSGTSVDITPGQSASVDPTGAFTVSATGDAELPVIHNSAGEAIEAQQSGRPEGVSASNHGEDNRGNGNAGSSSTASANGKGETGRGNSGHAGNAKGGDNDSHSGANASNSDRGNSGNSNDRGNSGNGNAGGNGNGNAGGNGNGNAGGNSNGNAGGNGNGGG